MIIIAQQGQTWDMIAFQIWGNELLSTDLMLANPKYHGVVIFEGGEELNVPDLKEAEDEQ